MYFKVLLMQVFFFQISVVLPLIRVVRHVVDNMKRIGPRLTVTLNTFGKMILSTSNLMATVDTHFSDLDIINHRNKTSKITF